MKKITLLFLSTLFSLSLSAKKIYWPLEIIVGKADLIVTGKISDIQENTYTFKVSETIKGTAGLMISVEKFNEWTCDIRFAKHQVGQALILFLQKSAGHWTIIDGGNGEIPIINQQIKLMNPTAYTKAIGNPVFSLTAFKTGIRLFCQYFQLIQKGGEGPRASFSFRPLVSNDKILSFKFNNPFTSWLSTQLKKYEQV
ncbi:MAG: hypothetical protein IBJ16_12920 [Chitinophagaceae bacterium]|nr:hypothetical protein [Chitinophagaceae bacterium]